jgi:hypothetical protein
MGIIMADKPFKQFERAAAALFGGRRHWANSGQRLDFESATALGQCKLVKVLSLAALSALAEEVAREALPKQKAGVVCVKLRKGKGRASPMLVVCTADVWRAMHGDAQDEGLEQIHQ